MTAGCLFLQNSLALFQDPSIPLHCLPRLLSQLLEYALPALNLARVSFRCGTAVQFVDSAAWALGSALRSASRL